MSKSSPHGPREFLPAHVQCINLAGAGGAEGTETMLNRVGKGVLILLAVWGLSVSSVGAQQGPPSRTDHGIVLESVELRAGVTADIHLRVFVDESRPCLGRTILAVPGFAHTAETYGPLAEALFASDPAGQQACRVVAIDFPAHGESGAPLPDGSFSQLLLDQYSAVVLAALDQLPAYGLRPTTVVAHSQGALVVQLVQQRLTDDGSSLRDAFNVSDVVLLAPVPPQQVFWAFADTGAAAGVLSGFAAFDPALGVHFAIPDPVWPAIFFSNLAGAVAPGAPGPAAVAAFNAPEPFYSALELVGALQGTRRGVDAGIFGGTSGTSLHVVSFEQDQLIRPHEAAAAYAHLTGDFSAAGVVEVAGPFAVHDTYISDPNALLSAIAGAIRLR